MELLSTLDGGKRLEITEEDYDYFLGVLPPVTYRFTWNGEHWGFGFAEGADYIYAFKKEGDKYFAQKTNLMNSYEYGVSLEEQLRRLEGGPKQGQEVTRIGSWIPTWIKLGKKNAWIREAKDPPFNTQSFYECKDDGELLDKLAHANWCVGKAFYIGDVCFIQQASAGDEWLAIKQGAHFGSISFGFIITNEGRAAAQGLIERIRAAHAKPCQDLN